MFNSIYALSFPATTVYALFLSTVWYIGKSAILKRTTQKHIWCWICTAGIILWIVAVLKATVLFRGQRALPPVWKPFQQIYSLTHGGNPEILRSIWMNILLFIPGGVILPELLPTKWRNRSKMILTVILAMLFSLGIELAQWHWRLGQAETDDVIANTLGALLGSVVCISGNYFLVKIKPHIPRFLHHKEMRKRE